MHRKMAEPEIIPPRRDGAGAPVGPDDETLNLLASLLDDMFRIPGTAIRFGLDPVIGLVPVAGDLISGLASFLIIFAAWERQLPKVTVARMVANVALDSLLGAVPVVGDAFDVAWKSNRKNLTLLQQAQGRRSRVQSWRDWLFLLLVVLALALLVAVPIAVLWLLIHALRPH